MRPQGIITRLKTHVSIVVCGLLMVSSVACAQDAAVPDDQGIPLQQAQISDKYARLEALMLRMAEFDAATNPRRAQILKKAYTLSKQDHVGLQLETIVTLLEQDKLSRAIKNQTAVGQDLDAILKLLLTENRSGRMKDEQARVQAYIKELERIIRGERWLRSRTEQGDDTRRLADQQLELQQRAGSLGTQMDENEGSEASAHPDGPSPSDASDSGQEGESDARSPDEGTDQAESGSLEPDAADADTDGESSKPGESESNPSDPGQPAGENAPPNTEGDSEGSPPSDQSSDSSSPSSPGDPSPGPSEGGSQQRQASPSYPGRQRVEQAKRKMSDAEKRLREAQRQQAEADQQEAIRELEQAKAELEEILRQLREEEIERALALLEARFRKMLDEQTIIYEKTQNLDKMGQATRGRQLEIDAGKLGFQERRLVRDAESALALLREEGSSVAFPESVEQMRDDMQQVAERLTRGKVGSITQGIEEDIITALEEMIESLQIAAAEQEDRRNQQQSQSSPSDQDQPLVNRIAELKMLRALQFRINRRTTRYSRLLDDVEDPAGQATDRELIDALRNLAEREGKLHKITREIVLGKNK